MVKINGISYKGNNLLINDKGMFIDGIAIGNCEQINESNKMFVGWFLKIFIFLKVCSPRK